MKRFWLILLALFGLRLALMWSMPLFDPTEARYAAIAANMARTDDFVIPHYTYHGKYQTFDGKPPLAFQMAGLACRAFGVREFSVRLSPFLSALLLLALLYHSVKRLSDADTARLAVLICATSTVFYAGSGVMLADMALACCSAGALLLYRCFILEEERGGRAAWAYAAAVMTLMGAGMIAKGPIALALFGVPALIDAIVNRRWACVFNVKWLATLPLFLLIATPWFVLAEQRNPGSVWYFFYNENFLRFITHDYGDKYGSGREAFRGVALVWALISVLPWALLPLFGLRRENFRSQAQRLRATLRSANWRSFELIGVLGITFFWCLTSRVLFYYLYPVIPLFAAWLALKGDRARLVRLVVPAAAVSAVVSVGILVGGLVFTDKMDGADTPYYINGSRYAFEFYHGIPPSAIPPEEAAKLPAGAVAPKELSTPRWE